MSLTEHLEGTLPAYAATKHPFLIAAGEGKLPHSTFALWLAQDRIYAAHAYLRFIGRLLAAVPFSHLQPPGSDSERRNQRVVKMLSEALANIVREVDFFERTAAEYGIPLEVDGGRRQGGRLARKGTLDYTAEMARIGVEGTLEDGIVFLWAMEKIYLEAWTNVGLLRDERLSTSGPFPNTNPADTERWRTDAAVGAFVENWTCAPFRQFVDDLGALVDSLQLDPGSDAWTRAEAAWSRVVELEIGFWPGVYEQ